MGTFSFPLWLRQCGVKVFARLDTLINVDGRNFVETQTMRVGNMVGLGTRDVNGDGFVVILGQGDNRVVALMGLHNGVVETTPTTIERLKRTGFVKGWCCLDVFIEQL